MMKRKNDNDKIESLGKNDSDNKGENPDFIAIRRLRKILNEEIDARSCVGLLYTADIIKDNLEIELNQINPKLCYRLYAMPNLEEYSLKLVLYSTRPKIRKVIEGTAIFLYGRGELSSDEHPYDFFKRVLPQYRWPEKKLSEFKKYCSDIGINVYDLRDVDCEDVINAYNEFHEKRTKRKKSK